jgi:ribosomal protein S18 acetylase RimI-like enzyme
MNLRTATLSDTLTLAQFNTAMAKETEDKNLDAATAISGVKRLLENPHYGFYIVAEIDGQTAGSLMITYEWSDWRDGLFWWIQSVYVKPEFRRRGIFRGLYAFVRSRAEQNTDVCGLRLYVEAANAAAQKTYEQMGMKEAGYSVFEEVFGQ